MALAAVVVVGLMGLVTAHAADKPTRVRLATLAPRGTSLHKTLVVMGEKWRGAPCGGVELTIYPDGTMGGEADMVRLMRAGVLSAGMFTVVGLSEIDRSVGGLSFLPLTFRSWEEYDYVVEKISPRLEKLLLDKGFVVLFWGDAGWVRFFSKTPAIHPDDFKPLKLFTWAGNAYQVDMMKSLGYHPVPLETANESTVDALHSLCARQKGAAKVLFDVEREGDFMVVMEAEGYNVLPDRAFIARVEELCGRGAVRVIN